MDPWPDELTYSMEHTNEALFKKMSENVKEWKATQDELETILVPTLVTCGKYDEITPAVALQIHSVIKGSRYSLFENSSHMAMWEERDRFMQVVREFLDEIKN